VDASAQPSVAQTFGVLTVPTTVVLDARGRPVAVNHGFTPADRLASQVRAALS
jgi:thioredoxin 1